MKHDYWEPCQATVFDQLWLQMYRTLQPLRLRLRGQGWPLLMVGIALIFSGFAVFFLLQLMLPMSAGGAHKGASAGALLLAMIVARHFLQLALQTLAWGSRAQQRLWANDVLWLLAALVVLPLSLFVAFNTHPLCGFLLSLFYGLAARCMASQWSVLTGTCVASVTAASPTPDMAVVTRAEPVCPVALPAGRKSMLEALRGSGVNVRIAGALVKAGYTSVEELCSASDAQILAVRGVGPATLARIRTHLAA